MKPKRANATNETPKSFWEKTDNFWHDTLTPLGRKVVGGLAAAAMAGVSLNVIDELRHDTAPAFTQEALNAAGGEFVEAVAANIGKDELTAVATQNPPASRDQLEKTEAIHRGYQDGVTGLTVDNKDGSVVLTYVNKAAVGPGSMAAATFTVPLARAQELANQATGDGISADELTKALNGQPVEQIMSSVPDVEDQVTGPTIERAVTAPDSAQTPMTSDDKRAVAQFGDVVERVGR